MEKKPSEKTAEEIKFDSNRRKWDHLTNFKTTCDSNNNLQLATQFVKN